MAAWRFFSKPKFELPPKECLNQWLELDQLHRCDLYTTLSFERLLRKTADLKRLFHKTGSNWNTLLYLMLFRTMSDSHNRETYMELARRVPYDRILRERPSVLRIEAMLFGAAGLLEGCREDAYIIELRAEFDHLKHKYEIEPLDTEAWQLGNIRPANHPRLRLAEMAAFLCSNEFLMERVLACRTREDIWRLFGVEASQYWSSYYNPSATADHTTKRLGQEKASLIGINTVAVLQYLYGEVNSKEELQRSAVGLWESLPPEENVYTKRWSYAGIAPANAFESQAQLQLSTEYCRPKRCEECPLRTRSPQFKIQNSKFKID